MGRGSHHALFLWSLEGDLSTGKSSDYSMALLRNLTLIIVLTIIGVSKMGEPRIEIE